MVIGGAAFAPRCHVSALPRRTLAPRLRVFRLFAGDAHSVPRIRRLSMTFSFVVLYAIPLSGIVRLDVWGGRHLVLGEVVPGVYAVPVIPMAIAALYLMTFFVNWAFGRLFCGFGCPVGQIHRIADATEVAEHRREDARRSRLRLHAFAGLLAGGLGAWFVDPRVLWQGSLGALAVLGSSWLALTAAIVFEARRVRWTMCRSWCPIGIYYSAIQLRHSFGVTCYGDRDCTDCRLCTIACPVQLEPRKLPGRVTDRGGLAVDGFPGANYCLSCGDCVRACAGTRERAEGPPPLVFGFGAGRERNDKVS